jgi:hypothetical protein
LPGGREARGRRFTGFGAANQNKTAHIADKLDEMSLPGAILAW